LGGKVGLWEVGLASPIKF
ncbi:MAG: hypothetical protein EZS28_049519, partial [Streblomastix strix]